MLVVFAQVIGAAAERAPSLAAAAVEEQLRRQPFQPLPSALQFAPVLLAALARGRTSFPAANLLDHFTGMLCIASILKMTGNSFNNKLFV